MTDLEKAEALLPALSRQEKARLLERLVHDLDAVVPGIESTPGVSGGDPCIVRTRIPVWTLVRARQLGASEAQLLQSYPSLRAEDLVHAWIYYDLYKEEVEQQIQTNETTAFSYS